jgi:hypothetical protein
VLTDNPNCPLDGSLTPAAEQVLPMLAENPDRPSLDALVQAGVPDDTLAAVLIVEIPDVQPVPWLLRPWLQGHREGRCCVGASRPC